MCKKALLIHPYLREMGGAEQVFVHTAKVLAENNLVVYVLGKLPQSCLFGELSANITEVPYGKIHFKFRRFQVYQKFLRHEFSKRRLKKKVGLMDYEILTQDLMFFLNVGVKKIAYIHYPENLWRLDSNGKSTRFWKLFYAPISRKLRQYANKIDILLCNSEYTKQAILAKWNRNATVIYPPVIIEQFKPAQKENFVVTIGRFVRIKNYEIVVEVAKLLPNVKFIIIGRTQDFDPYYEKIVQSKPKNLILMPNLSAEKMNVILSKAKIYLHTMIGEHFGISVVEAMAAGCVPVVHNSGGTRETVQNIGYTYNNIDECVDCITKGLASNVDPDIIAQYAQRFSIDNFKKNLLNVFDDCSTIF